MAYSVYILHSKSHDKFYIGQTNDLENRIKRHNAGYERYTSPFRPWKIVLSLPKPSRSEAMALEKKLKNLNRTKLEAFIAKYASFES